MCGGGRYKEISRKGGRICELLKDRKKKRDWERRRKRREREIERKCICMVQMKKEIPNN